jgi:hypothetical protein
MVITLDKELEAALTEPAGREGLAPEDLALKALRERFVQSVVARESQDDWERRLRRAASDCGVSLPDSAVSSEGIYD